VRVGEVAERAGVNVETLRYYERRGLLPAPERTPSGHRRYDDETVRFLGAIKEAQAVGFTLAEITEYLRAAHRSGLPSEVLRVRMAAKIDQIDARIAALQRMRDELARVIGCACTSLNHCTCGAAYLARGGGAPTARPSLLHITNGESAGNTLRQTALGGAVLPWQDVLHEGPVPALPRQKLLRTRARFLAGCGWGRQQALLSSLERRDRQLLEALRDNVQVVLWFEHDLYDQLQLLDVLALAHTVQAEPELIVIGSFPGKPSFAGLGELTASELETLWPSRRRAASAVVDVATSAWAALQAPEPTSLIGDARERAAAVPCPRAAAIARGAACASGRTLGDGTTGAPSRCRRRTHTSRRLRCSAGARGGSLHRRRLVLPSPVRPRTGKGEAAGNRGRHTPSLAASARRQPALRTTPIAANGNRRTNTARRSRSSRTSRHRPLDRRHPHQTRQHLAMGPSRAKARPTLFTLDGLAIGLRG
jgi:redox-sensitive transcriptional activator SoxR